MRPVDLLSISVNRRSPAYLIAAAAVAAFIILADIGPRELAKGVNSRRLGDATWFLTVDAGAPYAGDPVECEKKLLESAYDLQRSLGLAFIQPVYADGRLAAVVVSRAGAAGGPIETLTVSFGFVITRTPR